MFVLHFAAHRVENGNVRPTDRSADMRRANDRAGSPRQARRRTLFAPTVGPRRRPVAADGVAPDAVAPAGGLDQITDLALEEFVIDDDDYPEVSAVHGGVAPAAAQPDRVDDIDQWLEEFAVSDWLDPLPH
nr:hypothetical protein [Acidimicrobiales bacterium]